MNDKEYTQKQLDGFSNSELGDQLDIENNNLDSALADKDFDEANSIQARIKQLNNEIRKRIIDGILFDKD